jgi:ferredoxin-type protein NapF
MAQSISRMQFLRGDFRGVEKLLRPPWAVEETQFVVLCNCCEECIPSCPTAILVKGRAGYPIVDFNRGECEFCGNCVTACTTGALQRTQAAGEIPWKYKAEIADSCITYQGVVCRSCAEQCETRAIAFQLSAGRVPQPRLADEKCNGCGACVAICPVNAISVINPQ